MYDLPRELLRVLIKLRNRKMMTDSVAIQSQYRSIDQEFHIKTLKSLHARLRDTQIYVVLMRLHKPNLLSLTSNLITSDTVYTKHFSIFSHNQVLKYGIDQSPC